MCESRLALGRFVAVEGLPGSGKTTLGQVFEKAGWVFMDEVAVTLLKRGAVQIGDRGNDDTDREIFAEDWKRMAVISVFLARGLDVIVDGYFPTTIAFAYARQKEGKSKRYPELLGAYREALEAGRIILPDMYVRLSVPTAAAIERQRKRAASLNTLSEETLLTVEKRIQEIHEEFESQVPILTLSGLVPPEENEQLIMSALNGKKIAVVADLGR